MRAERAPQLHLVTLEFVVEVLEQLTHLSSSPPAARGVRRSQDGPGGWRRSSVLPPPLQFPLSSFG